MKVIKVLPDCIGQPYWLTCTPSGLFPGATEIIVCDDDPALDAPCYVLHVRCTKADIDRVSDLHCFHDGADAEAGGVPFAKNRQSFCVNHKGCPLAALTIEKLLFPLFIDQLAPNHTPIDPHWDH